MALAAAMGVVFTPAPPPCRPVTSAGLPRPVRLLGNMMLEKTVLRRCLTATCHQAPCTPMLDDPMSSSYLSWVGLTALRQCAVRAPVLLDVIKHPTSWYLMTQCHGAWCRAVLDGMASSSTFHSCTRRRGVVEHPATQCYVTVSRRIQS
jgi:hypothetical protein